MKNIRNIICILLVIAMLFTLAACGKDEKVSDETDKPDVTESVTEDDEADFGIGTVNNGRYENKFFGIGCDLSSGWTYAEEDELLAQIDIAAEQFSSEELKEQLKNADMFYDMMASADDGYANVNVLIQNIGATYGEEYGEEEIVQTNVEVLPVQMADAGMEVESCEAVSLQFAGEERSAISIHSMYEGVDVYQIVVIIKNGSYVGTITVTSFMEDATTSVAQLFYAV